MNPDSKLALRSGNLMPVMGLGTWQLTRETEATVAAALAFGYRLIDTACDYHTQPAIGRAIERSGMARSSLYIVAKVEETDDAYEATKRYIGEMGLDHADLMLIHRPPPNGPGEALWHGLIRAREDGLTRDIGVSNYPAELIDALVDATGEAPTVNQIEWSPFGHSEAMRRHASEHEIVIQAYSPLTRAKRLDEPRLTRMAERYSRSAAQLLIRWNLQRGTVPIPKANQLRHLEENIDVFDFEIEPDDMARLEGLNELYSSLGTLPYA